MIAHKYSKKEEEREHDDDNNNNNNIKRLIRDYEWTIVIVIIAVVINSYSMVFLVVQIMVGTGASTPAAKCITKMRN